MYIIIVDSTEENQQLSFEIVQISFDIKKPLAVKDTNTKRNKMATFKEI